MKVSVTIKPNSRKGPLVEAGLDGTLTVYVREPATDGKANTALIKLLAGHFDVPKTRIDIIHGVTSRTKTVVISP